MHRAVCRTPVSQLSIRVQVATVGASSPVRSGCVDDSEAIREDLAVHEGLRLHSAEQRGQESGRENERGVHLRDEGIEEGESRMSDLNILRCTSCAIKVPED